VAAVERVRAAAQQTVGGGAGRQRQLGGAAGSRVRDKKNGGARETNGGARETNGGARETNGGARETNGGARETRQVQAGRAPGPPRLHNIS
jgi:hypothetical protein